MDTKHMISALAVALSATGTVVSGVVQASALNSNMTAISMKKTISHLVDIR